MKRLLLPCLIAALFTACKPEKPVARPVAETPAPAAPAPDPANPQSFVGLTLEAAQKAADAAAVPHRVIEIDGQPQPATRDFRPDRLNFAVQNGTITAVTKG